MDRVRAAEARVGHLPRFARDGNLEDVLCKTHSDRRIFHSGSSFFDALVHPIT